MTHVVEVDKDKDAAFALARNVATVTYEQIPRDILEVTKNHILDTVGVCLAGSGLTPGAKEVVDLMTEWGGKPESTIWGFGHRVPAWAAAFANGATAHGLDYDNVYHDALVHPSAPIIPAPIAIAERLSRVSGKELLVAVVLGQDVLSRLGYSIARRSKGWKFDWHNSLVLGPFGATAACGKLLRLDEEQMVSAFGIVLMMAAGARQLAYGTNSELRLIYDAFPNKAGVLASLLAQKGVRGTRESLEGKAGLYECYYEGQYHRDSLVQDLGRRFEAGSDVGYKPWPACGSTHMYIDATLQLVREHGLRPQDIEGMTAVVGDLCRSLCEPLEARQRPETINDAKYSIPFAMAVAAVRRKVGIGDFAPEGIRDPAILDMAHRVTPRFDPELTMIHRVAPGVVEIRTRDGRTLSRRVDYAYGDAKNPMSQEDLLEKFRDCAAYSARPLSKEKVNEAIDMLLHLEDVDDVARFVRLLS